MRVCVCLNFEDNDTKRQARLWNQVSERAREFMESSRKKKRKEKSENERAGEIRRKEGFGIKWNVKEKKR